MKYCILNTTAEKLPHYFVYLENISLKQSFNVYHNSRKLNQFGVLLAISLVPSKFIILQAPFLSRQEEI